MEWSCTPADSIVWCFLSQLCLYCTSTLCIYTQSIADYSAEPVIAAVLAGQDHATSKDGAMWLVTPCTLVISQLCVWTDLLAASAQCVQWLRIWQEPMEAEPLQASHRQ